MAYFWLVVIMLGVIGYGAYVLGVGRDSMNRMLDWVLRRDSIAAIDKLEARAKELEEQATQVEKLRLVKKRITAAQTRIKNARG